MPRPKSGLFSRVVRITGTYKQLEAIIDGLIKFSTPEEPSPQLLVELILLGLDAKNSRIPTIQPSVEGRQEKKLP